MNKNEFQRAFDLAKTETDLSSHSISHFDGFGLKSFQPITATIESVARCIRWQCFSLYGGIDEENLTECRNAFRRKVTMVG